MVRKNGGRNKRDFYVYLLDWVWEYMVPIALIHEREMEAAFMGLIKLRECLRRKMPVRQAFEMLMNTLFTNKFKKKCRRNRYVETKFPKWSDISVCGACLCEEDDEISALTLMQVCFQGVN